MNDEQFKIMVSIWERRTIPILGIIYVLYVDYNDESYSFKAKPYNSGAMFENKGQMICLN